MIWRPWRHVAVCAVPPECIKNLDYNHVTRFIQRRCIILVMVKTIYFDVVKSYYHEWNGHNNSRIFRNDVPDDLNMNAEKQLSCVWNKKEGSSG